MQFHTFSLDKELQEKCVIATPFGKCKCPRLPMGFLNSPSWAQAAVDELFSDMTGVEVHVDDIRMFSSNCKNHIKTVNTVLCRLEQHDFTVKAANCRRLGWATSSRHPSQSRQKQAIAELQSFIGMVNSHRSFWKGQANSMAPLTAPLSGQAEGKSQPTPELTSALDAVKKLVAENVLLAFPDPDVLLTTSVQMHLTSNQALLSNKMAKR